jgi:DNA-binding CsgD family transcriptional regulator
MTTNLSPRQRECLRLLADGHTDQEVAELMGVGARTACRTIEDLRAKLGARNRTHAVALGFRTGALP